MSQNNNQDIDRMQFLQEMQLRKVVQRIIKNVRSKQSENRLNEEVRLRKLIQKLITEDAEVTPHSSTAINFLEDLLKKILPGIEQDYKSLTTSSDQRESFRAHFVANVEGGIDTADLNMKAAAASQEQSKAMAGDERLIDITEDEIQINVEEEPTEEEPNEKEDEEKFIDVEDNDEEEVELANEDTGSRLATRTYDKIENQTIETYSILTDEQDQKTFRDYLITNLKLYFDKWEQELGNVVEPTTKEYEDEKEKAEDEETDTELAGDDLGGEEPEEGGEGEEELDLEL